MGQDASHPVRLPPSHFLPVGPSSPSSADRHASQAGTPPPGCPMHAGGGGAVAPPPKPKPAKVPPPGCPMHEPSSSATPGAPPAIPAVSPSLAAEAKAGGCPIDHSALAASQADDLSSRNMMPYLPQTPLSASQQAALSTERETSTIPRALASDEDPSIPSSASHWVYPSAQQFYNALVRKGFETDEDDVDSMVFVHNVLNEVAWRQVLDWEKKRGDGKEEEAELMSFKGRPGTLSPKARWYLFLGGWFPESYNTEPPFDRHDWLVRRPASASLHRYVIDYYSAPSDADGSPNFNLDVRPALDDWDAVKLRMRAFVEELMDGK